MILLLLYLEVWYLLRIQGILWISAAAGGKKFDDELYYLRLAR